MPRLAVVVLLLTLTLAAQTKSKPDLIAGEWKGDSICVIKDSPCHDEIASYQFKAVAGKPGTYTLDGGKVVNGERVAMGLMECNFDAAASALACSDPQHAGPKLSLTLKDDTLTGTLARPDGQLIRRISLTRAK